MTCCFYREWLPLEKREFKVLSLLASSGGHFEGNLSDMCRRLSLTPQTKNRRHLHASIQKLSEAGMLEATTAGQTVTLNLLPRTQRVEIDCDWVNTLMKGGWAEEVSWEAVLKVLLWFTANQRSDAIQRAEVAKEIGMSVSTISSAMNVLEREFNAITRSKVSEKIGENDFRTIGLYIDVSAWWDE